jgi:hypothetical protein
MQDSTRSIWRIVEQEKPRDFNDSNHMSTLEAVSANIITNQLCIRDLLLKITREHSIPQGSWVTMSLLKQYIQ